MNQQEADLIAYARERLGSAASVLRQLEQGVGNQSRPEPRPLAPKPAAPPHRITPRPRAEVAPFVNELEATPVPACDVRRDYAETFAHWCLHARMARRVYAAERIASQWVDLGGEG